MKEFYAKMKKKLTVYFEILFVVGLVFISAGVNLMVRADLGISVASSMPYVISLRLQGLTFGTWSYLVQGFLVLLMIVIVRKVKVSYFLSFLVSVVFGILIDFFYRITEGLSGSVVYIRVLFFPLGLFILSFGIALIIFSRFPPIPFDLFVKEIALHKSLTFRKTKTIFDLSCLAFSSLFLLFFVHRLTGIGIGSVIAAIFNGTLVGFWLKHFELRMQPRYLISVISRNPVRRND